MTTTAVRPVPSQPAAVHDRPMTGRRGQQVWVVAASTLGVVCALLVGVLIDRPAAGPAPGARPNLRVSAESLPLTVGQDPGAFVPMVTVYYSDGTRGEGSLALSGYWRPDRPVRMVTVVASVACSIEVDDVLVDTEGAPVNRPALCVWTAPV